MKGITLATILTILAWSLAPVYAQTNYQFEHINSEDGLLDDIVFSIFQDHEGYIWIGSLGGLQRYDGYEFENFIYNPLDPLNGLTESQIRHIMQASDSTIWIGTRGGGINRYKAGKMVTPLEYKPGSPLSLSDSRVEDIMEDSKGGIWIATSNGLDYYKDSTMHHFKHDPLDQNTLSSNTVFSLLEDSKNRIWVGTQEGLNLLQPDGSFQRILHDPTNKESISGNFIHDIYEDSNGNIWLAIVYKGITRIDQNGNITNYIHDPADPKSISNIHALEIAEDEEGSLWVATWGGGLNKFENGEFTAFTHDPGNSSTISSNKIEDVMVDRAGNIWTANFYGGINQFLSVDIIELPYSKFDKSGGTRDAYTEDLFISQDSSIWIATEVGLGRLRNGKYKHFGYQPGTSNSLSDILVYSVFEDSKNRVWVVYLTGNKADYIVDDRVYSITFPEQFASNEIYCVTEDHEGNIWFGSVNGGICVYEGNDRFEIYTNDPNDPNSLSSNHIRSMTTGADGSIWIATTDAGLARFKNGQFTGYQNAPDDKTSIPKNSINDVAVDRDGNVWVGFIGGVAKLDTIKQSFDFYGSEKGLNSVVVESVCVDFQNNIWVATHAGGAKYAKGFDRFESLGRKEGFVDPNLSCVYCNENKNVVLFGASGKLYYYAPGNEMNVSKPPHGNLVISGFELTGNYSDSTVAGYENQLITNRTLNLPYEQGSFKIRFAALSNEIQPDHNYYFRVRNKDDKWTFLGNKNSISFSYLESGLYEIEIKNITGWGAEAIQMSINILPPWWATWWFRGLVLLTLAGIVYGVFWWRLSILKSASRNLAQLVDEKTFEVNKKNESLERLNVKLMAKIDQLKATQDQLIESEKMSSIGILTSGLAHELNNPLGYIGGMADPIKLGFEEIRQDMPDKLTEKHSENFEEIESLLEGMKFGVRKASEIIRNLLTISPKNVDSKSDEFDFSEMLEATCKLIQNANKSIVIDYSIESNLVLTGNKIEINQVMLNVVKNAVEAIPEGREGKVTVNACSIDDVVKIEVEDNGHGMDKFTLSQVFQPFYSTKGPREGTGLGLYISYSAVKKHQGDIKISTQKDKGSIFTITLPLKPKINK